ncbi:hypothetical protein DUI87_21503 [Hirundo rustica rustica]|uniref:Uncharacterized protein n=1 Tax=Hirundo rustica rustica TaxID=333673 RepID=A0A3M0JNQ2_HIRRU|nr:hypothetical protein DUI87_21503 [Hirundo rustica rustica]
MGDKAVPRLRLTWPSKDGGIMDARMTTDDSVLTSHASCTQDKAPYYPELTVWTHQPGVPSLKAAALSKSGGCLGHGQLGRDVEWLLCTYICFGAAPKVPAQINSPVTLFFVNKL